MISIPRCTTAPISSFEILADLDSLTETEVEQDGKRFVLRSPLRLAASLALRAPGVALPPTCVSAPPPDPIPPTYPQCSATALFQRRFVFAINVRGDEVALRIMAGLANGLSAEEIRNDANLSPVEYDSARRRMRRALIRIGLTGSTT